MRTNVLRIGRNRTGQIARFLWIVLLAGLLVGCTLAPPMDTPASTERPLPIGTPTAIVPPATLPATETAAPAATLALPTLTPTGTPTASQTVSPSATPVRAVRRCASTVTTQDSIMSGGSLVFYWREKDELAALSNASPDPQILLPGRPYVAISPYTGTMFWVETKGVYNFRKASGAEFQIAADESWGSFDGWLSDDRVIFRPYAGDDRQPPYPAEDEFYVVSFETGQASHNTLKMSGYFATGGAINFRWISSPIYDPMLSRALYVWYDSETEEEGVLLWDVENQKEIWKPALSGGVWERSMPDWYRDGSRAVMPLPAPEEPRLPDLYSITADGQATRLTYLNGGADPYLLITPKWSPDGRYVAFIYNADISYPLDSLYLYVLDAQTGTITDYCTSPVFDMYWSPDSKQLGLVFSQYAQDVMVLDLASAQAQSITGLYDLYGWVDWTPPAAPLVAPGMATPEPTAADRPERIYIWNSPYYGYLDPNAYNEAMHVIEPSAAHPVGPGKADALAFSYYSRQVAYLTQDGQMPRELSVANLDLSREATVWTDDENWLGVTSNYDRVNMRWGPGDRSIILETDKDKYVEGEYFGVLYSLQTRSAVRLATRCDHVLTSPVTGRLALGCPVVSGDRPANLVLEQDGSTAIVPAYPEQAVAVKDWAFSPDGSQVLYATSDDRLIISDGGPNAKELPMKYEPPRFDVVMRVLQWSRDGERVLIYGNDGGAGVCPSTAENKLPCWMVVDETTLDVIWSPEVFSNFDAALSPNGKRVVLFYTQYIALLDRVGAIADISSGEMDQIYDWVVAAVHWDGK